MNRVGVGVGSREEMLHSFSIICKLSVPGHRRVSLADAESVLPLLLLAAPSG